MTEVLACFCTTVKLALRVVRKIIFWVYPHARDYFWGVDALYLRLSTPILNKSENPRAKANREGWSAPRRPFVRNFAPLSPFSRFWMSTFVGFWGEMMHKNMNLLAMKNKFQQGLLNSWHIFYWYLQTARMDNEIWLSFRYWGASSVI